MGKKYQTTLSLRALWWGLLGTPEKRGMRADPLPIPNMKCIVPREMIAVLSSAQLSVFPSEYLYVTHQLS